jgi:hypothetical protein
LRRIDLAFFGLFDYFSALLVKLFLLRLYFGLKCLSCLRLLLIRKLRNLFYGFFLIRNVSGYLIWYIIFGTFLNLLKFNRLMSSYLDLWNSVLWR